MGALFDLSFTKFVSPTIARIAYIVGAVFILIAYVAFVVAAFDASAGLGIFVLLIGGPIAALFYLCILRVALESLIATILTAQNTGELVRIGGGAPPSGPSFQTGAPSGPSPGGYPPPSGQTPPAGPTPSPSTPPPSTPPPSAPPPPEQ